MQFMLTVHNAVTAADSFGAYADQKEMEQAMADTGAFNQTLVDAGVLLHVGGLMPGETATVVDATGGEATRTEGPYLPGERVGGFWVIEVDDREKALQFAAAGSAACRAPVEVRQFAGV
ncbi:YciI family protein [Kytococcus sedentarius]|uniref:YciI family protein n=1 Tax=Kytococcus sedentarius TaxID=1276 RepID=UPI0035BBF2EB